MAASGALEVLLLGPLELRRDGEALPLSRGKQRMLLADLAIHPGEVVSNDRLVDDLWGERPPPSAPHAVEEYVSKLRKKLGDSTIVRRSPGYLLVLEADRIDAVRFERRTAEGCALVTEDPGSAGAILREALALWRGEALAEFAFEPFAQNEIARLDELRAQCLEARVEADLGAGRDAELVPELDALVRASPLREHLRGQLMRALYRSGRTDDALAVYGSGRDALVESLGMEPGPELRALHAAILNHDESLLALSPPSGVALPLQRRRATVVAAELAEVPEGLDPEAAHSLISGWHELASAIVGRHGGRLQSVGDESIVAVFGSTTAREDEPFRAARTALELRDAVSALGGVRLRCGIETGEVVADGVLVAGRPIAEARAAARSAAPGDVVAAEVAAGILAHAARLEAGTRRLLALPEDVPVLERHLDTELVGREPELGTLVAALDDVERARAPRAVLVLGPAGIGKTRLASELDVGERALVLRGACVAEGSGSAYGPLRRMVGDAVGDLERTTIARRILDEEPAALLATTLGQDSGTASPPEVAWAFRRFCESLAAERPLVLVFDDVQWAEPSLLELIEQLASRGRGPVLMLCLAREELAEDRPSFLADAERLALDALSDAETGALLERLLAGRTLSVELRAQVVESAEGNPFFVEQLLTFVAEEGTLVGRPLPPTIEALLAARLDRLGPGERAVLSRAAVIGREFRVADLAVLLDPHPAATASRHLATLARRGFLRVQDGADRFRHVLVQEAAYRATPKAERAALHERLADHLARAGEADEIVGFHLERAHALLGELGADDRRARQLAADAGARLGAAGIAAWKRNDVPATVGLLGRATALLDARSAGARELMCELGLALRAGGDARGAMDVLTQASRGGSTVADAHIELRARIELALIRLLEGGGERDQHLLELIDTSIPVFEALQDNRALGRAWLLNGFVHTGRRLRCREGEQAAELALVYYRRADWPPATCLAQLASALYRGPAPAETAMSRCEALLEESDLGPAGQANVLVFLGGLLAMRGRFADGRALVDRARGVFEDLGQVAAVGALCGEVGAAIELLAGAPEAAEAILRESCAVLERAGLTNSYASRAGELSAALQLQGRLDDALAWSRLAERAASADDLDTRLVWQPVRAKLLAASGEDGPAQTLARAALDSAEATDASNQRATVFLSVAEVLRRGGLHDEADGLVDRARREYEQKGNAAALGRLTAGVA